MQKILNILKLNKVLNILIVLIVVYTMLSFSNITTIKSYAVGSTYTYNPSIANNDLPDNFDTLYPGYKSLIQTVLASHPTWTIKLIDTGLVWDTVINNEYTGHGSSPKNLVPANNSNYSGDWICPICGATPYDNGNWYCASRSAIAYMMDPRNSLNNSDIFQFQDLSSTTATRESIQQMVSGTFINNDECIDAILRAATTYSVSPYHLVSRIIQEQRTNGSTLGLGIEDPVGSGIKYYNLFNIGAAGNSSATIIANGLARAKSEGWDTMRKVNNRRS